MQRHLPALLAAAVVIVLSLWSSLFVVTQGEQALVLRFGALAYPDDPVLGPGLHVKKPFIEDVVRYDARVLDLDPPAEEVILADQKRIVVDTYTRFKIVDPLLFYQAVRTEDAARSRLREIVNNSARRVLGNVMLPSVLSAEREQIMHGILVQVAETARALGVEVVDVRIRRADLPQQTSQAIFNRMVSERQREAAEARAQGAERAQEIRAAACALALCLLPLAARLQGVPGRAEHHLPAVSGLGFFPLFRSFAGKTVILVENARNEAENALEVT
jgi:membrane protease subunit HflC